MEVLAVVLVLVAVVLIGTAVRLIRLRQRQAGEENRELPPLVYPARLVSESAGMAEPGRSAGERVLFNSTAPPPAALGLVRDGGPATTGAGAAERVPADPDATLQLLPGRLEPVDGGTQEIRFVRVPGLSRFTLGRNAGPLHSHIQLRAATASRMHAYMEFEGGRWQLGNMSQTNAVVLNGKPLDNGSPRVLADGDRIEFGELSFRFRER